MKQYNITVNGTSYEVEVEEVGETTTQSAPRQQAAPAPKAAPKAAPAPAQKPAQQPASQPAAASAGASTINAPMPGTVLEVTVQEGDSVKEGDVVLILEAMKMENEITAEVDGTVDKIIATKGTSVSTGDALVSLK